MTVEPSQPDIDLPRSRKMLRTALGPLLLARDVTPISHPAITRVLG
jgi:hypothetical protein